MNKKPMMLMILDGFGLASPSATNAISAAKTPNIDQLMCKCPSTVLEASGLEVGLPQGQMGNSEVGHLNIGAGRIVYQELSRISNAISDGSINENPALCQAFEKAIQKNSKVHFLGLLSDGGVHSHIEHLQGLLKMAKEKGVKDIIVHCFLDGRDVPPRCAKTYIQQLEDYMKTLGVGNIGTICGRYYAMDRDKRFDRVAQAYNAMVLHEGRVVPSAIEAINLAYDAGEDDEFIKPTVIGKKSSDTKIEDDDVMIMFNFRPDRAREITAAFTERHFKGFIREKFPKVSYTSMTQYDATFDNVSVAFKPETLKNTLGQYLSTLNLKQLRIAETEKYAHVTFFFNGGVEKPDEGEDRILINSPKVPTYDLQPEMSAFLVCDKVLATLEENKYDVYIVNFANADMVGHTGKLQPTIKAIEALDQVVGKIADQIKKMGGQLLITADHGNADVMADENGNPVTAHSTNKVPLIYVGPKEISFKSEGKLADIAPTMLALMNLDIPKEMTGSKLI